MGPMLFKVISSFLINKGIECLPAFAASLLSTAQNSPSSREAWLTWHGIAVLEHPLFHKWLQMVLSGASYCVLSQTYICFLWTPHEQTSSLKKYQEYIIWFSITHLAFERTNHVFLSTLSSRVCHHHLCFPLIQKYN